MLDNFSSIGTQRLYNTVLKPFFEKHISLQTLAHHPTKVLFEMFQSRGCTQFEIAEGGPERDDTDGVALLEGEVRCDGTWGVHPCISLCLLTNISIRSYLS